MLKPKIINLKKILAISKSEYEFDLINQIKFLQRINYNINLFINQKHKLSYDFQLYHLDIF